MRFHDQLITAAGHENRTSDFQELLRILDGELRLITPTDPKGRWDDPDSDPRGRHYQLTHDYLVPSLRKWLTQKQKETRRGRAELRLAERTALWNSRPQNQQLPAWWEYLNIGIWTRRSEWTESELRMIKAARKYYWTRVLLVMIGMVAIAIGLREINGQATANRLVDQLMTANEDMLNSVIRQLRPSLRWARPKLLQVARDPASPKDDRMRASIVLVSSDRSHEPILMDALQSATPGHVACIRDALFPYRADLARKLWTRLRDTTAEQSISIQRRPHAGVL